MLGRSPDEVIQQPRYIAGQYICLAVTTIYVHIWYTKCHIQLMAHLNFCETTSCMLRCSLYTERYPGIKYALTEIPMAPDFSMIAGLGRN